MRKHLNGTIQKMEEDKKPLASTGAVQDSASAKIVDLSKRIRQLMAQMETVRTKSLMLLKRIAELEKNHSNSVDTPRKKTRPRNTLALHPDVLWLSASHKVEIDRIKKSNAGILGEYRKKFDEQVKHVDAEHRSKEMLKLDQHKKDVNRVRDMHQKQIEKIVSSIQQQLDDLKDLSKAYWDQHAVADA